MPSPSLPRRFVLVLVLPVAALVAVLAGTPLFAHLATEWYWFDALGYRTVFLTRLGTKLGLGFGVGALTFVFLYGNLRLAQRGIVPHVVVARRGESARGPDLTRLLRHLSLPAALLLALPVGLAAAGGWLTLLEFLHRTPFGAADPVFGRDVGYYVFTLPLVQGALDLVTGVTLLGLLLTVPLYVLRRDVVLVGRHVRIEPTAQWHLAALAALLFVTAAAGALLVRLPSLVYSTRGPLVGASYTDLAVTAPALRLVALAGLAGAALVLWGARTRRLVRNTVGAVVLYVGVVLASEIAATAVQRFVVDPSELTREGPQLEHHIDATRRAWGLDDVGVRDLSGDASLTLDDIRANQGTIRNVRLWDRDPLLQTFGQLQEIRTYYDFVAVDDDRYWIDGVYRQVHLAPRELNTSALPARSFINDRLTFTHGMGLTLSPVNQVVEEGLPVLFIEDLPPRSHVSLEITRPELYFGEISSDYVFVNTRQREFDYPAGDENVYAAYEGEGGVPVASVVRKALFAIRFGSLNVLLSNLITAESRVLYHRRIIERAHTALPFLELDGDPYLVIADGGRLRWMLDAYTASARYPYSQPVAGGINYLRNSVKLVIDAYDGTLAAYVARPDDPIIRTYQKMFPGVFRPLDAMPADLRAHLRYPDDLFRVQTALYTTYHMSDRATFYHREDQWEIPPAAHGAERTRDPFLRHIVMKLPGEAREEFILMTPFTPRGKDNLAVWMVARMDSAQYGQLVVYRFPRQSLVFGPTQVINRINQDTEISQQVSLWDQRGSQVIRGNLLVIPIEESLIFVQAIYLRAEGGRIPELKRVVVAYENQVVMAQTLEQGLVRLFGGALEAERPPVRLAAAGGTDAATGGPAASERVRGLIREVNQHYDRATAAQRQGDWATYGEAMRRVGELLQELDRLVAGGRD